MKSDAFSCAVSCAGFWGGATRWRSPSIPEASLARGARSPPSLLFCPVLPVLIANSYWEVTACPISYYVKFFT